MRWSADGDPKLLASVTDPTDLHQSAERIATLGDGWIVAEPWRAASLASLKKVLAHSRDIARQKG